jgi:hypothetical protein
MIGYVLIAIGLFLGSSALLAGTDPLLRWATKEEKS